MNRAESEAEAIINRLIDCQMVAAMNNTELAEYYLSESEWQIVEDYLRIPGQKPTKPKPGFIGVLCGTPIVIQESTMKQPTKEQLNDPKWWAMNAPEGATHVDEHVTFYKKMWNKMFVYTQIGDSFVWIQTKPVHLDDLIERPEPKAEQRGPQDWLPPVGSECFVSWLEPPDGGGRLPEPVLIKGYHGDKRAQVWFTRASGEDMVHLVANCYFEPIQSEREKEAASLAQVMVDYYDWPDGITQYKNLAFYIHDAGYRKQMSRADAWDKITGNPECEPIRRRHADIILDALGFKE